MAERGGRILTLEDVAVARLPEPYRPLPLPPRPVLPQQTLPQDLKKAYMWARHFIDAGTFTPQRTLGRHLVATATWALGGKKENEVLSKLKHRNILELDQHFVDKEAVYLVFELLTTDLRNFLNAIPDGQFLEEDLLKLYCFQVIF